MEYDIWKSIRFYSNMNAWRPVYAAENMVIRTVCVRQSTPLIANIMCSENAIVSEWKIKYKKYPQKLNGFGACRVLRR